MIFCIDKTYVSFTDHIETLQLTGTGQGFLKCTYKTKYQTKKLFMGRIVFYITQNIMYHLAIGSNAHKVILECLTFLHYLT